MPAAVPRRQNHRCERRTGGPAILLVAGVLAVAGCGAGRAGVKTPAAFEHGRIIGHNHVGEYRLTRVPFVVLEPQPGGTRREVDQTPSLEIYYRLNRPLTRAGMQPFIDGVQADNLDATGWDEKARESCYAVYLSGSTGTTRDNTRAVTDLAHRRLGQFVLVTFSFYYPHAHGKLQAVVPLTAQLPVPFAVALRDGDTPYWTKLGCHSAA